MLGEKITNEDNYNLICDLTERTDYLLNLLKQLKLEIDTLSSKPEPIVPTGESVIFKHFEDIEAAKAQAFNTGIFTAENGASGMIVCVFDLNVTSNISFVSFLRFNSTTVDTQIIETNSSIKRNVIYCPITLSESNNIIFGGTAMVDFNMTNVNIFIIGKNLEFA